MTGVLSEAAIRQAIRHLRAGRRVYAVRLLEWSTPEDLLWPARV